MSADQYDADVVIIGGGISGMSAAYYLWQYEPSLNILILEANNFIGGRTLTLPLKISSRGGMRCFELGDQFITSQQTFIQNLLKNLNLDVVTRKSDNCNNKMIIDLETNAEKPVLLSLSDFTKTIEWSEVHIFLKRIDTMCINVTFDEPHINEYTLKLDYTSMDEFITSSVVNLCSQNLIRHIVETSCGVDASQISVLFYLAYCNSTGGMQNQVILDTTKLTWIKIKIVIECYVESLGHYINNDFSIIEKGGADNVCQKIANLIGRECIKTNSLVTQVIWNSTEATIKTEEETYTAKHVILAIPPSSILKMDFYPPIKENRLNVFKNMNSGKVIKFVVTYETAFWKLMGFNGTILRIAKKNNYINWCFDISHHTSPALCGYINTDISTIINYRDQVLHELATCFGSEALSPVDYAEKDWSQDKNSYGYVHCMSIPKMGYMNEYSTLRRPLGNLFWAGSEMATCWIGQMEGAVQAGYRAASEVLYRLRPQRIIFDSAQEIELPTVSSVPSWYSNILKDWKTVLLTTILTVILLKS